MINNMFEKGAVGGLEQAVQFARQRHRVIANNIANVETPDYRAKALNVEEFQNTLKKAFKEMENRPVRVFELDEENNIVQNPDSDLVKPHEADPVRAGILKHDRNNVNIDREMAKMSKNFMYHEKMMNFLRQQLNLVEQAIREEAGR